MPHDRERGRGRREQQEEPTRHVDRPSSELIGLLRRTHALMESGELARDVDTVASVFEGVVGFEAVCARHTFCSRAVEALVRVGSDAQRRRFFTALLDSLELEQLLIDRYASHLVDLLCTLALEEPTATGAKKGADADENGDASLIALVVRIADGLAKSAQCRLTVCYDRYGSHVVQSLLATLSGEPSAKAPPAPDYGEGGGEGFRKTPPPPRAPAAPAKPRALPPAFGEALLRLVAALAAPDPAAAAAAGGGEGGGGGGKKRERGRGREQRESDNAGPSALCAMAGHSCATLCVQSCVAALRSRPAALLPLLEAVLGWPGLSGGSGASIPIPPAGSAEAVRELAISVGGARALETMLSVAPGDVMSSIYSHVLRGHMLALSLDRNANFVVQRFLERASGEALIGLLVGELDECGPELLRAGKAGVIWKLVEACARARCKEKEGFKVVARMLAPASASAESLASAVLGLSPSVGASETPRAAAEDAAEPASGGAGGGGGGGAVRVNALGSRLAQACLLLAAPAVQPLVASLHKLPTERFVALACDGVGSRVVEALFTSHGCPPVQRAAFAKKLRGHAARLARDKCGSHALEKCFAAVDVEGKRAILDELLAAESALASSPHASLVFKKVRLLDYKRRQHEWVDEETANQKKRRMFAEILAPAAIATAEAAAAQATETAARALGGSELSALVSQLGYGEKTAAEDGAEALAKAPARPQPQASAQEAKSEGAAEVFGFLSKALGATGSDKAQRKRRKREREEREKAEAEGTAGGEGTAAGEKGSGEGAQKKVKAAKKFSMS